MIAPEASVLLSESSFTESVPLSSTFQDPAAKFTEVWAERARLEKIADQVGTTFMQLSRDKFIHVTVPLLTGLVKDLRWLSAGGSRQSKAGEVDRLTEKSTRGCRTSQH